MFWGLENVVVVALFYYPLTPKSDQQLISPYIITPESARTKEALDC